LAYVLIALIAPAIPPAWLATSATLPAASLAPLTMASVPPGTVALTTAGIEAVALALVLPETPAVPEAASADGWTEELDVTFPTEVVTLTFAVIGVVVMFYF